MIRLFGYAGVILILNVALALATGALLFRLTTVVVGLAIVGLYAYLHRSQPATSGTIALKGLQHPVEVYRDGRGIPHIYAATLEDLYCAQGYIAAQDRLWQMELNRRLATGQMAAVLGEEHLDYDRHLNTLGLRSVAEASLAAHSPAGRSYLSAYAAGINARIAEGRLAPEFALLGLRPEPWSSADILAIAHLVAYKASETWADPLFRAQLLQQVSPEKAAELIPHGADPTRLAALAELELPEVDRLFAVLAQGREALLRGRGWVVAGNRTQSGSPFLGGERLSAPRLPATCYQMRLAGPAGLNVGGIAIPGLPGIIEGNTREFAWSLSAWSSPAQDLVVERVNPENPHQLAFAGGWETARQRVATIRVRGRQQPVYHDVLIGRHGPLIARGERWAIALRATALEPGPLLEPLFGINQARCWSEFRRATEGWAGAPACALFAGRDGTIAHRVLGPVPVRSAGDGELPALGWNGVDEWAGYRPADALPEAVNPAEGYLVAADDDCGADRLAERLRNATGLTLEKAQSVCADQVNTQARTLLQPLLNSLQDGLRQGPQPESLSELEKRALLMISSWHFEEEADSPQALLWRQWYLFLLEQIFRPQMGLPLFQQFLKTRTTRPMADRLIAQAAAGEPSLWLGLTGEDGLPRVALASFRRSVALLAAKYGPRPDHWRWRQAYQVRFRHSLSRGKGLVAHLLDLGPVDGPPSPFGRPLVPVWRRVVSLAQPGDSADVCAPGVSGHPLSPYYSDQLSPWVKGELSPQTGREVREGMLLRLDPDRAT